MKRFEFSLAKLLDYRWQIELEAKREYANCQRILNEKEERMQGLMKEKQDLLEIREDSVNRMQIQQWYLLALERQMTDTHHELIAQRQLLQEALDKYIDAQKERKILEKLKEKQLAEYEHTIKQEEQKMLDEMGTRRIASAL